jgi:translation initiation factor eIF-2B subunit delta
MGNSIRQLKYEIANIPPDTAESESKEYLCDFIDTFIKHRIEFSQTLIAHHACTKIKDKDVILTYAHSTTVLHVLLEAATKKKISFRVIVVDSRPLWEGRKAIKSLMDNGIQCSYASINSIGVVIKEVECKLIQGKMNLR